MLLSYTAHVTKDNDKYSSFIYGLPVRYSIDAKALEEKDAVHQVLDGVSNEMNAYLRMLFKRKFQIPLPYIQPSIENDYDIPVSLDLAFAMVLRFFRSNRSQKDLAKCLDMSPAYLSTIETLDKGVTLEYAAMLLSKLGLRVYLGIHPYKSNETVPFQYSPDGYRMPVLATTTGQENSIDYDIYRHSGYIESRNRKVVMPFPAHIREYCSNLSNSMIFEISFPALERYGLNFTLVDTERDRLKNRAIHHLNLTLLACEKRIEYPKIKKEEIIGLWSETASKVFPNNFRVFTIKLAKEKKL